MNRFVSMHLLAAVLLVYSCTDNSTEKNSSVKKDPEARTKETEKKVIPVADVQEIMSRKQVPVLCYHHIREAKPGQSESMKSYSVSPAAFAEQMQTLADSGYKTILPDQLYNYLAFGEPLPEKPIMLTFDDTDLEQYTIGAAEMKKHGFKGVFFIMTISINRPRYMSKEQLKELSDDGNVIADHTWDHHMVTKYQEADWDKQLVETKKKLEDITGKPVEYFAYPFGIWNRDAIAPIKSRGYKMAFQLSTKRDSTEPLYTVRRMIVPGTWSTAGTMKAIRTTFNQAH